MKPTAFAATAALVAVARMAVAQAEGTTPAVDPTVRAASEAHALVASMQQNARIARDALELARVRKRPGEIRCADEALSRADVALRRAREDTAELGAAGFTHDANGVRAALDRVRLRADASHEAAVLAMTCSSPSIQRPDERTRVIVRIDPGVARIEP